MKQVTMESVKQRIADLELADNTFGLGLNTEFELACLRELVAVTEQRDALVMNNWNLRDVLRQLITARPGGVYFNKWEPLIFKALNETPATDAAIASLRAEAFNDLCKAFVLHKESACLNDTDKVSVREATDALLHCAEQLARQLRESKGEVQS